LGFSAGQLGAAMGNIFPREGTFCTKWFLEARGDEMIWGHLKDPALVSSIYLVDCGD
jgi:hypothetical protein